MDDYIAKPVRPRDVAAALTTWAQETEVPVRPDPAETPASDPIDEDRLAVLRQVNPSDGSLLPRLIEAFIGDLPGTLDEISTAIDDADDDALHRSAHRLKGAALTIGAAAVGAVCERLEAVTGAGGSRGSGAPRPAGRRDRSGHRGTPCARLGPLWGR